MYARPLGYFHKRNSSSLLAVMTYVADKEANTSPDGASNITPPSASNAGTRSNEAVFERSNPTSRHRANNANVNSTLLRHPFAAPQINAIHQRPPGFAATGVKPLCSDSASSSR